MAVDPSVRRKYEKSEPNRGADPSGPAAAVVATVGTVVVAGAALLADGSAACVTAYAIGTFALSVVFAVIAIWEGWQEDGLFGALYSNWLPLGSWLGGESPSWMRFALVWIWILACVLCGILLYRTPGAVSPLGFFRWFGVHGAARGL